MRILSWSLTVLLLVTVESSFWEVVGPGEKLDRIPFKKKKEAIKVWGGELSFYEAPNCEQSWMPDWNRVSRMLSSSSVTIIEGLDNELGDFKIQKFIKKDKGEKSKFCQENS